MRHLNFNKKNNSLWIILSLISFILLLFTNVGGVGFTYDSFDYAEAASNLDLFLKGNFINERVIKRPPVYPIIVSLFFWIGDDGLTLLNMILYVANFYLVIKIVDFVIEDEQSKFLAIVCVMFSVTIHLVHAFAWTEGLVVCLMLLQIKLAFDDRLVDFKYLLIITLGVLSVLTKKGAMLLVPGMVLMIYLSGVGVRRWAYPLLYCILCWGAYQLWDGLINLREPVDIVTAKRFLSLEYLNVLSVWLMPLNVPSLIRNTVAIIILLLLTIFYIKNLVKKNSHLNSLLLIFVSYTLLRSYYSNVYFHEAERYLSLVYPLFIIILFSLLSSLRISSNKILSRLCWIFGLYILCYTIIRAIKNDYQWIIDRLF